MGVVRSGLVTVAALGLFGLVSAAGCTAAGDADDLGDTSDPNDPAGAQLPPSSPTDGSAPSDAGKSDSGKKDASVDAGPPPPTPGDPCPKVDEIRTKPCGACGEQETICLASGDGGGSTWTEYSACTGEIAGGCIPGTTEQEACGNCGTLTKTCTKYCAWQKSTCGGQPKDSCTPGGVELSAAGCTTPNTYRQRACPATCVWNTFSAECSPPPTTVEVPPTQGGTNYTIASLSPSQVIDRIQGSCPSATISTLASYKNTQYVYLQVHNSQAKPAVVTIFTKQATGGSIVNTVLAAYDGAAVPTTEAARKACVKGVAISGDSSITGNVAFASLHGTREVTIPAGGTVTVYVAGETNAAGNTGLLQMGVRTESLD